VYRKTPRNTEIAGLKEVTSKEMRTERKEEGKKKEMKDE
jgi:hypothetical protein